MIARNFEEWKDCIVNDCRIKLTRAYAQSRLKVYENRNNRETKEFIRLYGENHWSNVVYWLKKAMESSES
ncbi:MAG: hypothetical protein AAGG68_16920 [Bacteroidota bacterium]